MVFSVSCSNCKTLHNSARYRAYICSGTNRNRLVWNWHPFQSNACIHEHDSCGNRAELPGRHGGRR